MEIGLARGERRCLPVLERLLVMEGQVDGSQVSLWRTIEHGGCDASALGRAAPARVKGQ